VDYQTISIIYRLYLMSLEPQLPRESAVPAANIAFVQS